MSYYAVHIGHKPGIYNTWDECNSNVSGYKGAKYKKFKHKDDAEYFVKNGKVIDTSKKSIFSFIEDNDLVESNNEITVDKDAIDGDKFCIYTDGACSDNGTDTAKAGIGVYFGENDKRNISSNFEGKQTNNTAELTAILAAYKIIEDDLMAGKKITIYSDSKYAIRCCTTYGEKMDKKEWVKDIPNKELVKDIYQKCSKYKNLQFEHIKAHTDNDDIHSIGNEMADRLANKAIGLEECPYLDNSSKIYIDTHYLNKNKIKLLGGKWDKIEKKWYINNKNGILDDKDVKIIKDFFRSNF